MAILATAAGLVLLFQGVAWVAFAARSDGSSRGTRLRGRAGAVLAPLGLLVFSAGLAALLVPDFFGGRE